MKFDAIVIGGGHNGLIFQAYMARKGLKTLCIERNSQIGGGLTTTELPLSSGYHHNLHSFYHRAIDQMPWFKELELQRHGVAYVEPSNNVVLITRENRTIIWSTDFQKTLDSLAEFSQRDAEKVAFWRDRFQPILNEILIPENCAPPLPQAERTSRLKNSENGQLLLEVARSSPLEFVMKEFEHPTVQAALLFFNGLREVDLRCPGFGHHIPALLASERLAQMCVGGSQSLAKALEADICQNGGEFLTGVEIDEVLVEQGRAKGVRLQGGETIECSRLVATSLNPQQSFLELLAPQHTPEVWRQRAESFRYNLLAPLFSLHLNLLDPPKYSVDVTDPFMVILGLDHVDQFQEIVRHHEHGTLPGTVMWGSSPTLFDRSQAPADRHTAFMWQKLPYRLQGNPANWDQVQKSVGDEMLSLWNRYAPNLEQSVEYSFTQSPVEVERALPNMKEADLLVGAFTHDQIGYHRPFPGAGHYRTHLEGYYLCGSCCHPGGNITGLPGYNCAQVVAADFHLDD